VEPPGGAAVAIARNGVCVAGWSLFAARAVYSCHCVSPSYGLRVGGVCSCVVAVAACACPLRLLVSWLVGGMFICAWCAQRAHVLTCHVRGGWRARCLAAAAANEG
jgi:hypothetical protein